MLSERLYNYARQVWEENKSSLLEFGSEIQEKLDNLKGDKRCLMELCYGTLPVSDLGSVDFEVFEAYADHALMLRENSPYCKDIAEDIFIHNVFYPRINSEDIVDCRGFFHSMLMPLIEGMDGIEAVKRINIWCGENMSYEMTDTRSINPITAYNCSLGRCGEESTFAVTAMRSVGIPARQIYVPWWSHCDDNHAWVEVYAKGSWHYLGACEPEPELDRGWFTNASTRAMVICCRNYFDYVAEGLKDEQLIQKKGICLAYNQVQRYAETVKTKIRVLRGNEPVKAAELRFYVENMAGLAEFARIYTDSSGEAEIITGLGSMMIQAEAQGRFAFIKYRAEKEQLIEIKPEATEPEIGEEYWDFYAPESGKRFKEPLSKKMQQEKADILLSCTQKRDSKIKSSWKEKYEKENENVQNILRTAAMHSEELYDFIKQYGKDAENILSNLPQKDWRDADSRILLSHIIKSAAYKNDENYLKYIGNPRIGYEKLSDWRSAVENYLTEEQQECFKKDPAKLWLWINENFRERQCRFHPVLWLQPGAALRLKSADERGRRLLFAAVLRTLGRGARLNPVDSRAEYFENGRFISPEAQGPKEKCTILHLNVGKNLIPHQNFGLSCWDKGWISLNLYDADLENLELPPGLYCLHTVNRLPNGNQLISHKCFRLSTEMSLDVNKRKADIKQLLADYKVQLPVENSGLELQIYLEAGKEPCEHSLNELMAAGEKLLSLMDKGLSVKLIFPDEKELLNKTVSETLKRISGIKTAIYDFSKPALESFARALYLEPGQYPIVSLSDGERSYFAQGGYSVGSIGLALQLAELLIK